MKKFWKYLLIIILLLLGLCCIGVLYLFFVPASSLFNITYISLDKTYSSQAFSTELNFTTIEVNSRSYDVQLVPVESSNSVSVQVYANSFGFVLTQNKAVSITSQIVNNSLIFNISEPYGMALKNQSKISIFVPANSNFNLTLANDNANTSISSSGSKDEKLPLLSLNDVKYTTNNGNFNISNCNLAGNLYLNLGSAVCSLGNNVYLKTDDVNSNVTNNVYLNMTSGKFRAADYGFNEIVVESNNNGVIIAKSCQKFNSKNTEAGGSVELGTVALADFVGADTNIYINELDTGTIRLTKSGSIEIGEVTTNVSLESCYGSISVKKATGHVFAESKDSGSINIENSSSTVDVTSVYGDISVSFADGKNYDESDGQTFKARNLVAKTVNGLITARGVQHIKLDITGRGRAHIYMDNVFGNDNYIHGKDGEVYVQFKELSEELAPTGHAHYQLKTKSSGQNVSINLSGNPQAGGDTDNGYHLYYVHSTKEDYPDTYNNEIEINTDTGSLKVRDDISANF